MNVRSVALAVVTVVAGLLLLWWFTRSTGLGAAEVLHRFSSVKPGPLMLVLVATAASAALGGEKWRLAEGALSGRRPTRRQAIALSAMGTALGQVMPAPIASALVRGVGVRIRHGGGGRRGALASVWEQLFDIAVFVLFLGPAAAAVLTQDWRFFVLGAPIVAVLVDCLVGPGADLGRRYLPGAATLLDTRLCLSLYRLSLLRFVLLTVSILGVAATIRSSIPPVALAAAIPPVGVATVLSFVPAGLGVSEWTYVVVLSLSGVAKLESAAFALMTRLLVGFMSLGLGWAAMLLIGPIGGPRESSLLRDDADSRGAAGQPLDRPLDRVKPGADQDEREAVAAPEHVRDRAPDGRD